MISAAIHYLYCNIKHYKNKIILKCKQQNTKELKPYQWETNSTVLFDKKIISIVKC